MKLLVAKQDRKYITRSTNHKPQKKLRIFWKVILLETVNFHLLCRVFYTECFHIPSTGNSHWLLQVLLHGFRINTAWSRKPPQTSVDLQESWRTLLPFTLTHPWFLSAMELVVFLPCIYHSISVYASAPLICKSLSWINNAMPYLHGTMLRLCKASWSMWQTEKELLLAHLSYMDLGQASLLSIPRKTALPPFWVRFESF